MHARFRHEHGTTLIELVASIVIVSVATFGLMLAITSVIGRSADPMIENQAAAIAEAYLEEVSLASFCDPDFLSAGQSCRQQCTSSACGNCGGAPSFKEASRALYDDVCDYDGDNDVGARDRNGSTIDGLGAYEVSVDIVDDGASLGSPALSGASGEVVRIQVTVRHAALSDDIILSTYRANTQ